MEKLKLPSVHEHPLYRVGGNHIRGNYGQRLFCDGCSGEGHIDDGFRCSVCPEYYLHRKCGETPLEINHPSHPQHLLKLRSRGAQYGDQICHLCGVDLELLCYHCSICDFTLDIGCAINPPPLPILEKPKAHEHPLTLMMSRNTNFTCHVCGEDREGNKFFYSCSICEFFVHIECASLSPEINHPFHPRHLLKLLKSGMSQPCNLCWLGSESESYYHCSICNFTLDLRCVLNPLPLALVSPKTHNHQLTFMPRLVYFTCNACGMAGDRSPYVCAQCNFMIHSQCIDLPSVIYINRHDHRISHTYDLADIVGDSVLECGVCRQTMDPSFGAYCCLKCKNYAVHSRCATKNHCWDGRDIEGEPEEIEDVAPFKVIGDGLIKHFSHEEHDMKLIEDGSVQEGARDCQACIKPISERFYKCIQCDYTLHETCANLPLKIRSVLLPEKSILVGGESYSNQTYRCVACKRYSSGFRYRNGRYEIDLQCISVTEPLEREAHNHPLYYFAEKTNYCDSCCEEVREAYHGFECLKDDCEFSLDFKCSTYPERVKHKSDDHTLRLHLYCENGQFRYDHKFWCDICEKQVDHTKHYYTCDECATTLHIKCVLGDLFGSIPPGSIVKHEEVKYDSCGHRIEAECWRYKFEVVSNTSINRPLCSVCRTRCTFSLVLRTHDNLNRYVCSYDCLINPTLPTN